MKINFHKYQKSAIKFVLARGAAGLFLDPGLGKTAIILAVLKILLGKKMIKKTLVIAPLQPCYNVWPNEIEKWDDFSELSYSILHGKYKDERLEDKSSIHIINPDGLQWLKKKMKGRRWPYDVLVVDELSQFKNYRSLRFRILKEWINKFKKRFGLTGSPVANGLIHIFPQVQVLDGGRSFGPYFTHFRTKYFVPLDRNGWNWAPMNDAEDRIWKKLKPLVLRMEAEDYLELPKLHTIDEVVTLPGPAQKLYDSMEEDLLVKIEKEIVSAANAASASVKCRQIASGHLYIEDPLRLDGRDVRKIHDEKLTALKNLVEELQGEPLLVAYEFNHERESIRQILGPETPHIGGGVPAKVSREIINKWNAREIPVLLAHPRSLGHGVNLQSGGSKMCWFSLTWDYELYDQFIRRLYRQGATAKRIFIYRLVAKDTIDETMAYVLKSKKKKQDAFLEGLKARRR